MRDLLQIRRFAESHVKRIEYRDASQESDASGHVALLLTLEHERGPLLIANTHLKWDPPDTHRDHMARMLIGE